MKLFTKVSIILMISGSAIFVLVGFLILSLTKPAFENIISHNQDEIAVQTMDKVDRLLYERYLNIQSVSSDRDITQYFSSGGQNIKSLQKRIYDLTFLTGPWDELTITDDHEHVLLSSSLNRTAPMNRDELVAYNAARGGNIYYSDHIIYDHAPTIIFAAPIRSADGTKQAVVGVVIGRLAWPVITEILRSFNSKSKLALYNNNAILLATNQVQDEVVYSGSATRPLVEKALSVDAPVSGTMSTPEGKFLVSAAPSLGYLSYKGSKWVLLVETPFKTVFAPANDIAAKTAVALLFVLLIISALTLRSFRRLIVKPIEILTAVTKDIVGGDLKRRASISSSDEVGTLAQTFNQMLDKISGYNHELQEKVNELLEEHSRFIASINSLKLGFIAVDKVGNIIAINPAAKTLFDFKDEEVTLPRIFKKINPDLDLLSHFKQTISEERSFELKDVTYQDKTFKLFLAPITVYLTTHEVIGAVILLEDVTEEKIIERSRDEFFSIASHELRTPLTAIRGNASMLMDFYVEKMKDPDVKQMVSDMFISSERLIRIVNDFLNVSRLEQGKMEFRKTEFNIVKTIETTLGELEEVARKKNIVLKLSGAKKKIPNVIADQDRTKQVIMNLVGNAINHSEGGSVTVSIDIGVGNVAVNIKDTGVGISPENQALLFRKFQQAGSSIISRDVTGTGLGLYISKLIVEGMGGEIRLLKSAVGKGSTFAFTVPIVGELDVPNKD